MAFNNQFTVPYLTPRGNTIDLPVPDLPDSEKLRVQLRDPASRPTWARAYLDDVYAEYRELDNRRRSDISVDQPGHGDDVMTTSVAGWARITSPRKIRTSPSRSRPTSRWSNC